MGKPLLRVCSAARFAASFSLRFCFLRLITGALSGSVFTFALSAGSDCGRGVDDAELVFVRACLVSGSLDFATFGVLIVVGAGLAVGRGREAFT